ncbi:hypothetical protein F2Q70_00036154 [Brassica cretica]|uniref:Uncharacterized protein n=1 Tax=Brassica cretica TaxID=69181 RepID=A0A8S9JS66_BRACR|nr:hypothetical protein F2Q70_00036154 [Brassica cretica]
MHGLMSYRRFGRARSLRSDRPLVRARSLHSDRTLVRARLLRSDRAEHAFCRCVTILLELLSDDSRFFRKGSCFCCSLALLATSSSHLTCAQAFCEYYRTMDKPVNRMYVRMLVARFQGPSSGFLIAGTWSVPLSGTRGSGSCLEAGGNDTGAPLGQDPVPLVLLAWVPLKPKLILNPGTGCKALCLDAAGRVSGRTGRGRGVNFVTLAGSSLTRHVALRDHGVGLDGQSCSCLIVGWPVGLSSPTLGVGRPSVIFLFNCWPVTFPSLSITFRSFLPSAPKVRTETGLSPDSSSIAAKLISSVPRSRHFGWVVSRLCLALRVLFFAAAWLTPLTSKPPDMT